MHATPQPAHIPFLNRRVAVVLATVLAIGTLFAAWLVAHADRCMRELALDQARRIVQTIDVERLRALSGSAADLTSPIYRRLKEQLACTRDSIPDCAFIYLMARQSDGTIIFLVDSEPVGSVDESPPGQIYSEITDEDRRAFTERIELVSGPASDRWGTWISALVPLVDPQADALLAVLGIDVAANDWRWKLFRAAMPALLLTLSMIGLLIIGAILIDRRAPSAERSKHHPYYRDTMLAIVVIGTFLSLLSGWIIGKKLVHGRQQAFRQLAHDKSAVLAKTLHTLKFTELEALGRLFTASEYVSQREFEDYSNYLLKNPVVDTWAWIQRVPAAQRDTFEMRIRAEGLQDFSIWQWGADGQPTPVTGRNDHYPVVRAVPVRMGTPLIGFDLGSDPQSRAALQASFSSGLNACTAPVAGFAKAHRTPIIQVYHPVFTREDASSPQGFARADIQPEILLRSARPNDMVSMELAIGIAGAAVQPLAASWPGITHPDGRLAETYPMFAFGRALLVTAHAGSAFFRLHTTQSAWLTAISGLMITAILASGFSNVHRRRERLEMLVDQRTRDLIESQNQVELAIDGADLGTWDWRIPSDTIIVNEKWAKMLGYLLEEIEPLLTDWRSLIVTEDRSAVAQAMRQHLKGQSAFFEIEHRLQHRAGYPIWVLTKGRVLAWDVDGSPLRVCGTSLDTTKHRRVKAELKTSETRLRTLIDTLPDLVWLKDPDGVFLACNKRFERLYGAREADIVGKTDYDFVEPALADFFREKDQAAMAAGKACVNEEKLTFADDGHHEILETIKTPMVDGQGDVIGVLGIARNISERKQAEEKLRLSEEKFSKVFAMAPDCITITRLEDGLIADVNMGFEEITGWTRTKVIGKRSAAFDFWVDPSARASMVDELKAGRDVSHREMKFLRQDGTIRTGIYSARVISVSGERYIIFVMQDVTENRQLTQEHRNLEQQLNQSQKLEAIGILAGGVAHDFNNMLGAIIGYAELADRIGTIRPGMKQMFMSGYPADVIANRGVVDEGINFVQKPFSLKELGKKIRKALDE